MILLPPYFTTQRSV